MGIFSRFLRRFETAANYGGRGTRSRVGIATPGTSNTLANVLATDYFGAEQTIVSREQAMSVPAVAGARWLICHPLSRQPLYEMENGTRTPAQPAWLQHTGGVEPWQFRMSDSLDDALFEGWSLWKLERSTDPAKGWRARDGSWVPGIDGAVHVPLDRWDFTADDLVAIDNEVQGELDVLLFRSPTDPFLTQGRFTIKGARALEEKWQRGLNAIPVMEIRQTEDIELADADQDADADPDAVVALSEAQQIVDDYVKGRNDENGAVVFTPHGYELVPHGQTRHELYVEGRNFSVLDVARHLALNASLLNGSQVSASLTYETKAGGRSDHRDLVQTAWAMAFEARLSMDDVCPPGRVITFDLSDLAEMPDDGAGPDLED